MTGPNATAIGAMAGEVVRERYLAFIDIKGDPKRVTTLPYSIRFEPGQTGDADLDGFVFSAIDPTFVSISEINRKEGGTDTVTVALSGLPGVDDDDMNLIGDKANWQGRPFRLWECRVDDNLQITGNIWTAHTGYMTVPKIVGDGSSQIIQLQTESYLRFLTSSSGRTYLGQADFDPDDLSAAATIACANGTIGIGDVLAGGSSSNPRSGFYDPDSRNQIQ